MNEAGPLRCRRKRAESGRTDPHFYDDLEATLAEAWRLLLRGAADRRSPFHAPTLATLREDGAPALRTVVLRAVDPAYRTLRFHTDIRSSKFGEIARMPRVAVHLYDPGRKIQLRVDGEASLHTTDQVAVAAWNATRSFSRSCYRVEPAPGRAIEDPYDISLDRSAGDSEAGRGNFAAVTVRIERLEWLYLAARGHRRAGFSWNGEDLSASWLVP